MNSEKQNTEDGANGYGIKYIQDFLHGIIDLRHGVDKAGTINEIKAKKSMSGANAWMLMCSIIIASIGLDRDSDAVIIGGMLISPLMSPILGIGLAIGINDKEVLKKSLIHYSTAIIIALVTSFLYFTITPFGKVTPAILARTAPDTLDVLVAVFGGLAGIISIARKDISTTLPGVAIATALMPPLCVTGFGLAQGNWNYAINSFYLLILNTSFISLSTYIIVRYLRFPYRRYVNPKERRRNRLFMGVFALLIIIPSFFILSKVLQNVNTQTKIKEFISVAFGEDSKYFDAYTTIETDTSKTIVLKVYGEEINEDDIPGFRENLKTLGLSEWRIELIKSSEVDLNKIQSIEQKIQDIRLIATQQAEEKKRKERLLEQLSSDSTLVLQLENEIMSLYPEIIQVAKSDMRISRSQKSYKIPTILIDAKNENWKQEEKDKLYNWLKTRTSCDTLQLIIY